MDMPEASSHTNPILIKDGSERLISWKNTIIKNDSGEIKGILSIGNDITKRKKAEAALRESEEKFRTLITNIPDIVWTTDINGNTTYIGENVKEIYGFTREEIYESGSSLFLERIHPEDIEYVNHAYKKLFLENTKFDIEYRIQRKDGHWIWLHDRAIATRLKDGVKYAEGIFSDITNGKKAELALQQSESKLRQIIDLVPHFIYVKDEDGKNIIVNKAVADAYGTTVEEIVGKPDVDKTSDKEGAAKFIKDDLEVINSGKPKFVPEEQIIDSKGNIRLLQTTKIPFKTSKNEKRAILGISIDITESKKAEEALSEKTLILDNLLKSSVDMAIATTDLDFRITYFNPIAETFFGYSAQEVIGKTVQEIHIMENVENERLEKAIALVHRNGEYKYFVEQKTKDGIRYLESRVSGIYDSDNIIVGYALFSSNITKRKKAEDDLQKLSTAVHQSPSVIAITNLKGNLEYVNPKFTELTGYTLDEAKGLNPRVLKSGEQPDEMYKELWQTISSGKEWHGEFRNKKKNGELLWELASVSPIFDKQGKITNYIKVAEDISERKRSEQVQKVMYNISNAVSTTNTVEDLICQIKIELGSVINTTNFYVAFYDSSTDMLSLPYYSDEKDSFTSVPAAKTLSKYVIDTKKPLLADIKLKKKLVEEGVLIHQGSLSKLWLGVPLKTEGKVIGVFAVQSYTDENAFSESDMKMLEFISGQISISIERKKKEQELIAALEKATESDRLKTAFLNNFSHEIRTPMNGILGFVGLLKQQNLTGDQKESFINIIETSSDRMLVTVDDLVNISMIEAGQMKVSYSETNINKQAEDIETLLGIEAKKKGLQLLLINSLPANEANIITDNAKIYGILTNLVKNAIKFTHEGSVKFGLSRKGVNLEFFVEDTGIGVPNDRQKAIFDRFVKADIEDKGVFEGSGLGLTIAKAYVEMLGGNIWLESEEGIGTKFCFTIPYNPVKKGLTISNDETLNVKHASSSKDLTILIVEDEEVVTQYLSIILRDLSVSLLYSTNGFEAVEICRNNPNIDLVLMDIKMPIMGGYKATEQIRKFNKDVIIIAQTAYALKGDQEKAIESGCNDYISKPINKDKLIEMIGKWT